MRPPRALISPPAVVILACAALSALSLLIVHHPTYDPYAWLIWGRQIADGTLDTVAGPSWKPLPVLLTTPFSLAGDDAAPLLWLVVARTGFLLAIVMTFRVAQTIAGTVAGVVAAVGVVMVEQFASFSVNGDSEGLLVALVLGAVDRHLAGRRGTALALGFAAGLLRPEVWPFLALYGVWLAWRHPRRWPVAALLGGAAVIVVAAWLVPEGIGSGSLLRGASRAREPVAGSPGASDSPFLEVFRHSATAVPISLYVGGVIAVGLAAWAWWRRREGVLVLLLALGSSGYMVIVAVLAAAGFTGNTRYVLLPASIVCVLGGAGLVQACLVRRRPRLLHCALLAAAIGLTVGFAVSPVLRTKRDLQRLYRVDRLYDGVDTAIANAGGPAAVLRCRPLYTGPFETQLLTWKLHVHADAVLIDPRPPGTTLTPYYDPAARDKRFQLVLQADRWVLRSTCGRE